MKWEILPSGNRSSKYTSALTTWVTRNKETNLTRKLILSWINVNTFNKLTHRQIQKNLTETISLVDRSWVRTLNNYRKINSQSITSRQIVFQAKWKPFIGKRFLPIGAQHAKLQQLLRRKNFLTIYRLYQFWTKRHSFEFQKQRKFEEKMSNFTIFKP